MNRRHAVVAPAALGAPLALPVARAQAPAHELVVNRNAAKSLGLTLSVDLLKRANKVIG